MQSNNTMKEWLASTAFGGANQSYIEDLYESYLTDPNSVSDEWQQLFQQWKTDNDQPHAPVKDYFRKLASEGRRNQQTIIDPEAGAKQVRLLQWINAYRFRGHLNADLDPLKMWNRPAIDELDYHYHGFSDDELDEHFNIGHYVYQRESMTLREIDKALKETYCGHIGIEFMHITDIDIRRWLQEKIESVLNKPLFSKEEQLTFLKELTAADGLERYLGAKFPGAKRFSLEGSDAFIPLMKEIIRHASKQGVKDVVMGMAHRGRLNMLVNVLGKNQVSCLMNSLENTSLIVPVM